MDREQYLKLQLSDLQKSYQDAAKPLVDELVKIASRRVNPMIIPAEQWAALCEARTTDKRPLTEEMSGGVIPTAKRDER